MKKILSLLLLPSLLLVACTSSELEQERERSATLEKNVTDLQSEVTQLKTENEKSKTEFEALKENLKNLEGQMKNIPATPPPAPAQPTTPATQTEAAPAEALPLPPNATAPPVLVESSSEAEKAQLNSIEMLFALKKYNNVLTAMRNFYLKYPKSGLLQRAKIVEARTYEKLGKAERAATVYGEVISLSPQTDYANEARAGMLRMQKGVTP